MFGSCTIIRRKLVTHSTLNFGSGEVTPVRSEWVTEPCNVPLFGGKEGERGICKSCASGWTHPHNYPAGDGQDHYERELDAVRETMRRAP